MECDRVVVVCQYITQGGNLDSYTTIAAISLGLLGAVETSGSAIPTVGKLHLLLSLLIFDPFLHFQPPLT